MNNIESQIKRFYLSSEEKERIREIGVEYPDASFDIKIIRMLSSRYPKQLIQIRVYEAQKDDYFCIWIVRESLEQ